MNRIAGESLFNLGREDEALPYLRSYASTTDRVRPSAFYILGVGEYRLGNYQAAIRSLGHAATADDAMGQSANLILGQSYLAQGNAEGDACRSATPWPCSRTSCASIPSRNTPTGCAHI